MVRVVLFFLTYCNMVDRSFRFNLLTQNTRDYFYASIKYDRFHVIVQKLVSYHKHENYVVTTKSVLMRMIVMKIRLFSWTYWDLDRTNETSESVHFIWRYIHETSKALYYVFEFKCSKVLRIKKPGLGICLSYKILRIFLLRSWQWSHPVQGLCITP